MSFVQTFLFLLKHLRSLSIIPLTIVMSFGINGNSLVKGAEGDLSEGKRGLSQEISLTQTTPLTNGVYLYGRSPEPETLGKEYLVFKVQEGEVMGAFYMPRSEFNCFSGSLNSRQMNLSITDPYDGTKYNYAIALRVVSPIATNNRQSSEVTLEGYHRLDNLSDNDQRILNTCINK